MSNRVIQIAVADAQILVREGMKAMLASKSTMRIVAEASDRQELTALLNSHNPDVLALDYSAGDKFSPQDVAIIKDQRPLTEVLIISADLDRDKVRTAMKLGAKGFLTKDCGEMEILGAIEATARGEKFFCNKVLDIVLEREEIWSADAGPCDPVNFTNRESDIIRLMAQGRNAQEIATELSLSVHTVYTHRKNIHKKLGVSNATEVILYAIRSGLVDAA